MNSTARDWIKVAIATVACMATLLASNYPIMRIVIRDVVREELQQDSLKYETKEASNLLWSAHAREVAEIRARYDEKISALEVEQRNIKRIIQKQTAQ